MRAPNVKFSSSDNQIQNNDQTLTERLYTRFLQTQRLEQLVAIKNFQKSNSDQKHEMITLMSAKIFALIQESRAVVEASSFIPGISEFPTDEVVRSALSNIIEKVALFAEFTLRFPDICKSILATRNNYNIMFQWGITYCYQVDYLLDESTKRVIHLVSQELNYIKREPEYTNPYRLLTDTENDNNYVRNVNSANDYDDDEDEIKKIKKKRKKVKKGPKVSYHDDL